ncbi:hypothetical protein HNP84_001855 [Thermocatellispora tengchongensis]|uniref:NurA domain-containing protein n=1 Tax=Thermocatellispora tengchongensis TaxID=1073253 RepID=A0A840NY78_9ACTN|nr:hypothetical protein [Thermocatellispora tengchongensis]MBB5132142.1 hypothetical protein [Thermocatellispora tengchongensis]
MTVTSLGSPGFTVDPWDPGYAAALAAEALTEGGAELGASSATLDLEVEVPAAKWGPVTPAPGTSVPAVLLIADGVRRIDARVWIDDPDGAMPAPGIAASYAAGLVRCEPGAGNAAVLAALEVRRSLFSPSPHVADVVTGVGRYSARPAADGSVEALSLALQQQVTALEVELAASYRAGGGQELLLVDGPLRGRTHLSGTVGYIKTHHTAYLPPPQAAVVSALRGGQRTPVFQMGTSWRRHAWYLRLPTASTAPWAGIARCEAGADLSAEEVVTLADAMALVLPSLAGVDYKDPRAPQNLVPIGGLERLLRHRLGEPRVLYRALRASAARPGA